jgi:hypothetical protein
MYALHVSFYKDQDLVLAGANVQEEDTPARLRNQHS